MAGQREVCAANPLAIEFQMNPSSHDLSIPLEKSPLKLKPSPRVVARLEAVAGIFIPC